MSDAWATIAALGQGVTHDAQEAVRQALVQSPVFSYPSFQPIEQVLVVSAGGLAANVAETTLKLPVPLPSNTSAVVYLANVNSTATAAGTVLEIKHKAGGLDAGVIVSQVVNFASWGQIAAAPNSGQVTYALTKNGATAFSYAIWVVGFFRSY